MDKKSAAIKGKPSLAANKATKPMKKVMRDDLEKINKKNVNEKKEESDDTKEVIERLADRVQRIEEKMDLLITLISPNNKVATAGKTGSVKAETESNSSDDEEPSKKKAKLDAETPSSDDYNEDEESDDEKETYPYSHGLYVGDRFAGGRCGGRGFCGLC